MMKATKIMIRTGLETKKEFKSLAARLDMKYSKLLRLLLDVYRAHTFKLEHCSISELRELEAGEYAKERPDYDRVAEIRRIIARKEALL